MKKDIKQVKFLCTSRCPGRIEYLFIRPEHKTFIGWSRTINDSFGHRVFEGEIGEKIIEINSDKDFLNSECIDLLPEKNLLASRKKNLVEIWDFKRNYKLQRFKCYSSEYSSVAFAKDSDIVATSNNNNTTNLWFWKTGKLLYTLNGILGRQSSIKDNSLLNKIFLFTHDHKNIDIYDSSNSNNNIYTLKSHTSKISSIVISNDENTIVTSDWNAVIKIYNLQNKEIITINDNDLTPISSIAIIPNTEIIVSGNWKGIISLWNWKKKKKIFSIKKHKHRIRAIDIKLFENKIWMITGGWDNSIIHWKII